MDELGEEVLGGGNMEPVTRVHDTVRRVSGPWTTVVHHLLRCYESAGIVETPRASGVDGQGREILTFIGGDVLATLPPETLWRTSVLRAAAGLLRRLHDASSPLTTLEATWRSDRHPPVEVICHNDFAPYNLIVRDDRLVGVIDFDMASPGSRLWDVAYLAYRLVPWAEDAPCFDGARFGTRDQRLRMLVEAYGGDYLHHDVRQTAAQRLDELAAFTARRAAQTGRSDFLDHAAMYRRDAQRLRENAFT